MWEEKPHHEGKMGLLWSKRGGCLSETREHWRRKQLQESKSSGVGMLTGGACEYLAKEAGGGPEAEEAAVDDAAKAQVWGWLLTGSIFPPIQSYRMKLSNEVIVNEVNEVIVIEWR